MGVTKKIIGQPYCENDYNQMFCPRCMTCQQPIVDKCVNANGKKYHPHHFACTGNSFRQNFFIRICQKKI